MQLVLDETCTKDLTDLLDLAIAAGLGVTVNIVTGTPPVSWLLALYWALVTIEAFVVDEVVKRTDKGEGVTMNISWIPIGLDTLASIASAGTAAPEIPFIIQAVEQATLLGELSNPGGGSLWYSFFWITAN